MDVLRCAIALVAMALAAPAAWAQVTVALPTQPPASTPPRSVDETWRRATPIATQPIAVAAAPPATAAATPAASPPAPAPTAAAATAPAAGTAAELAPVTSAPLRPRAKVTQGPAALPNDAGQVWREYDISPYTLRSTATARPEQAIVDWILRETGYETWHGDPLAILSASPRALRVYHTPETQAIVADIVDRFVSSEAESQAFALRLITMDHPNWRARAASMLRSVPVQTQGLQAWLAHREDAALLLAELRRRSDYREYGSQHVLVNNGQTSVINFGTPRSYVRQVLLQPQAWPGFQAEPGQFDEGYSLEFSPLMALDGRTIDAVVKVGIDQLEKLVPVMIDVPTPAAPRQRTRIDVPQTVQYRMHERFRWPADEVLIVALGVVPSPVSTPDTVLGLPLPLPATPDRAELLLVVESKGRVAAAVGAGLSPPGVVPAGASPMGGLPAYPAVAAPAAAGVPPAAVAPAAPVGSLPPPATAPAPGAPAASVPAATIPR